MHHDIVHVKRATPLILVELNEVNFEYIERYVDKGRLRTFGGLIENYGIGTTTSESVYSNVEPWIQWVTAHTGKTLAEHGVFRLGDIVGKEVPQIWEILEASGVRVAAMSPMNAENRLNAPAFFVPDPWTHTRICADSVTRVLHRAVVQAVGDNASGRVSPASYAALLAAFVRHVRPNRWWDYIQLGLRTQRRPWLKVGVLDSLLADIFQSLMARTRPAFASIFLNGAAHIQHHYLFSSSAYDGDRRNPEWYVPKGEDPLLDIYEIYDVFLRDLTRRQPNARLIIATGLHQDSFGHETYYWRLIDHERLVRSAGLDVQSVHALMSRDFVVNCRSSEEASRAESVLVNAYVEGLEAKVFHVENRGTSLFCSLVFEAPVNKGMTLVCGRIRVDLAGIVAFVALKNGHHNPVGYIIDSLASKRGVRLPLTDLFGEVKAHFGLSGETG